MIFPKLKHVKIKSFNTGFIKKKILKRIKIVQQDNALNFSEWHTSLFFFFYCCSWERNEFLSFLKLMISAQAYVVFKIHGNKNFPDWKSLQRLGKVKEIQHYWYYDISLKNRH